MRPLAFLDTGAIFALTDPDDRRHEMVRAIFTDPERRFFLHGWVLAESFSLLTKGLHKRAALLTVSSLRLSRKLEIVAVSRDRMEGGWERCQRFADKEWDWVDCVSFELMQRRGVREALSLDRHFAQAGFTLLVP